LFKETYGRELIGKDLGQFHGDFSAKELNEEKTYARRSIFLGKKSYIDELVDGETKDENGNLKVEYHIRMKGIPSATIIHYCEQNNITPYQLYERLYNGEQIQFDLCATKCRFQKKAFAYQTLNEFNRRVQFPKYFFLSHFFPHFIFA
jgi:hypothetical protein